MKQRVMYKGTMMEIQHAIKLREQAEKEKAAWIVKQEEPIMDEPINNPPAWNPEAQGEPETVKKARLKKRLDEAWVKVHRKACLESLETICKQHNLSID